VARDDIAGPFLQALAMLAGVALLHLLFVTLAVLVGVWIGGRMGRGSGQERAWKVFGGVSGLLLALFATFVAFQFLR